LKSPLEGYTGKNGEKKFVLFSILFFSNAHFKKKVSNLTDKNTDFFQKCLTFFAVYMFSYKATLIKLDEEKKILLLSKRQRITYLFDFIHV